MFLHAVGLQVKPSCDDWSWILSKPWSWQYQRSREMNWRNSYISLLFVAKDNRCVLASHMWNSNSTVNTVKPPTYAHINLMKRNKRLSLSNVPLQWMLPLLWLEKISASPFFFGWECLFFKNWCQTFTWLEDKKLSLSNPF